MGTNKLSEILSYVIGEVCKRNTDGLCIVVKEIVRITYFSIYFLLIISIDKNIRKNRLHDNFKKTS